MQPSRIVLLVTLVLVIGAVAFGLFQDPGGQSDDLTPEAPASEAVVSGEIGAEVASEGKSAADEATDLITKRLLLFMAGGIAAGVLMLIFVIPWLGDAAGTFFYSSEEEMEPEASGLAIAKVAQGDYEGAITEYRKLMEDNPTDRFPVIEIAKIYLDRLGDPDGAVDFLEESLDDREWPVDDAAFLMFRTVDIEFTNRNNPIRARELLSLIVENFEGSRHAANAQHRIEEIDSGAGT